MNRRAQILVLVWLLLSAMLFVFTISAGREAIQENVVQLLQQHLMLTLDEAHFSSADNEVNDVRGLQNIGKQMNVALQSIVTMRWFGSHSRCAVALSQIDDVSLVEQSSEHSSKNNDEQAGKKTAQTSSPTIIMMTLPRNHRDRDVGLSVDCSPNWLVPAVASVFLGLLFFLIQRFVPPPMSGQHRAWMAHLAERGYADDESFALVSHCDKSQLTLNTSQRACFEQLHDPAQRNFVAVVQIVAGQGVAALDEAGIDWFVLGISHFADAEKALALATAPGSIEIDLTKMSLRLRGLSVPMSGTPLFYYAWYALQRRAGDGWVTNPASNRPDLEVGQEIAQLMSLHKGHGRAIKDLEQGGLKARTLDQNRSKIKEDIVSVLGEKLAEIYLFETSKHPDGIHMQYRLRLDSSAISVVA